MLLFKTSRPRRSRHDMLLGAITALNAGLVNVCSVMAFFAFSSNITGHVAIFTEEISKGHWYQVSVVVAWMFAFLFGAFLSKFAAVTLEAHRQWLGQAAAHLLQVALLAGVAYYGHHHYAETLSESEVLVGVLLLTMGLQNSSVASASDGSVKTTHLTGLFTDLGTELAMLTQARHRADRGVVLKFTLHGLILARLHRGRLAGRLSLSTRRLPHALCRLRAAGTRARARPGHAGRGAGRWSRGARTGLESCPRALVVTLICPFFWVVCVPIWPLSTKRV